MLYTHCSHSNTYPFFTIFCFFLAALSMLYGSRIASLFALFLCTVTAFVCHLLSFCLSHQCSFLQTDCSVSVSIKLNMVKTSAYPTNWVFHIHFASIIIIIFFASSCLFALFRCGCCCYPFPLDFMCFSCRCSLQISSKKSI